MSFLTQRSSMQASSFTLTRQASLLERSLTLEYRAILDLFKAQPALVQFSFMSQAQALGEALIYQRRMPGFSLPHWVVCTVGSEQPAALPASFCWQKLGSWKDRFNQKPLLQLVERRLSELERENHPAVAAAAALLRFSIALHLVHGLLPPANSIDSNGDEPGHTSDTIVEGEAELGTVLVENHWMPVQPYVEIFKAAYQLAAYISVDEEYRLKHFRLLGRWMDQCRALAAYETDVMIQELCGRVEASALNRGLSLSLPYFDDQQLEMRLYDFTVIPAGRIPFDPEMLILAARAAQVKLADDPRMSVTTRIHLIAELRMIEKAIQSQTNPKEISVSL